MTSGLYQERENCVERGSGLDGPKDVNELAYLFPVRGFETRDNRNVLSIGGEMNNSWQFICECPKVS